MSWLWRFRKCEKGQGLIELAVVLPLVLFLMFGMMVLSMSINAKIVVSNAAREGARIAATGVGLVSVKDRVEQVMKDAGLKTKSPYFNKNSDVLVALSGNDIRVTVLYRQPTYLPLMKDFIGSDYLTLRGYAVFRREQ